MASLETLQCFAMSLGGVFQPGKCDFSLGFSNLKLSPKENESHDLAVTLFSPINNISYLFSLG